jgi:hypothetical protein
MNENRVVSALARSGGSGRVGGAIARTVSCWQQGVPTGMVAEDRGDIQPVRASTIVPDTLATSSGLVMRVKEAG